MTWEELLAFFDDVIVFSATLAKHCESLDPVLTIIEKARSKVDPEKCHLLPPSIPFVGHIFPKRFLQQPMCLSYMSFWERSVTTEGSFWTLQPLQLLSSNLGRMIINLCGPRTVRSPSMQNKQKKQALCRAPVLAHP